MWDLRQNFQSRQICSNCRKVSVRTHTSAARLEFSALLTTIRGSRIGFIANPVNE
jgi:hypothetical protein